MVPPSQPKLRLKDRRRRLMWVKVAAGASVVLVSFAAIFFVSRLSGVTIASVNVTGTNLVSADDVQAISEAQLQGSYGYLVPRRNALVVPTGAIQNAIEKSFPPVESVAISKNGMVLNVAITERKTQGLWCGESASSSGCYLMDGSGFIFAKVASETGFVRYYGALSGSPIGATYLGGDFAALNTIVTDIGTSVHRTPDTVTISNGNTDVALDFAEGGELRFERTAGRQTTLENVASVFASQDFKTHSTFEYVDFRFGNKVYVKFK